MSMTYALLYILLSAIATVWVCGVARLNKPFDEHDPYDHANNEP